MKEYFVIVSPVCGLVMVEDNGKGLESALCLVGGGQLVGMATADFTQLEPVPNRDGFLEVIHRLGRREVVGVIDIPSGIKSASA